MTTFAAQRAATSTVRDALWNGFFPVEQCLHIEGIIHAATSVAKKTLSAAITAISAPMEQQIAQLNAASIEDKRKILNTIPIVSAAMSAAFLGVPEHAVLSTTTGCRIAFGGLHLNQHCYAMDELTLIAANPAWTSTDGDPAMAVARSRPAPIVSDNTVFVAVEVAVAFTGMSPTELENHACSTVHYSRSYCLADLEKIRASPLKTLDI